MWVVLCTILFAYLVGAIPFGLVVARLYGVPDLRAVGSGNIGATNVWRAAGLKAAVWVFILDIGKGVVAVVTARQVVQNVLPDQLFLVLCAVAAVLGHVVSPYLGFRGGKGVNTGLGVMLVLMPREVAVSLGVFFVVVAATRYISVGSMAAGTALSLTALVERFLLGIQVSDLYLGLAVVLTLLVFYTHRANLRRLREGTEHRFRWSHSAAGGSGDG